MRIRKFLSQSPLFALYLASRDVMEAMQSRLRKLDMHFLQGLILTAIFFEDRPIRPSELSQVLQVDRSTLSHALRGLERSGWIRRDIFPGDARGYAFTLSPAGKRKTHALIKEFDWIQQGFETRMGIKRTRDVVESLDQLRQAYPNGKMN